MIVSVENDGGGGDSDRMAICGLHVESQVYGNRANPVVVGLLSQVWNSLAPLEIPSGIPGATVGQAPLIC